VHTQFSDDNPSSPLLLLLLLDLLPLLLQAINLEDNQRKARVVALFANRITDPKASQLLPVLLKELDRASPAVIV
jgi:hypothetical protein